MLEFLNLKTEAFGIDISDLSLKIVSLKKNRGKFELSSFGSAEIKPGIIRGGEIKKEDELVKIIKKTLSEIKGKKISTKYVVASLPEEKSFLQIIQMPILPEEDLKAAVIFESENYIPLPVEQVYLDSQIILPVKNHLDHNDVLIAALPRKTVDSYVNCLKLAGLQPVALEIESVAIVRSLIKNEISSRPILIIDFGASVTRLIIFSGTSIRFTFSIPVSSNNFTESIARTLEIDVVEAEKLKLKYGVLKDGDNKVFEALIPPLTDLVEQIKKFIEYYQAHASHEHLLSEDKKIEKVFLCGGGAGLKGFKDFLSKEFNLSVDIGNPWVNVLEKPDKEILKIPQEKSLGYATATGLALRGIKINDKSSASKK
jgi:type IV pilus assembly protein PilM